MYLEGKGGGREVISVCTGLPENKAAENRFPMRRKKMGVGGLRGRACSRCPQQGMRRPRTGCVCSPGASDTQRYRDSKHSALEKDGEKRSRKISCAASSLSLAPEAIIFGVGSSLPEGSVGEQSSQRDSCTYVSAHTQPHCLSHSKEKKRKKVFPLFLPTL